MDSETGPLKKTVAIIGGGSSALMLGCTLNPEKFDVTIYEKNATLGRKFLVAGDGGLNLTHSESPGSFISRYTPSFFLEPAFSHFSNLDFINWINKLGIETFVGSSGRIFPNRGIKPVEVLNAFLDKMKNNEVFIRTKHEWKGFSSDNTLLFGTDTGDINVKADLAVFCLGGASWPITGSKGDWAPYFAAKGITVSPFVASNCYFETDWFQTQINFFEGKALKNCSLSCGHKTVVGEVVLTKVGIEGSGIYPLSPQIRQQLTQQGYAEVLIDLKPGVTEQVLKQKINQPKGSNSYTKHVSKHLNLNPLQLFLLKNYVSKADFLDLEKLPYHIKNIKLKITGLGPVDKAISTVGGVHLDEITHNFELKKTPGVFIVGEMLDYDAPTGGYLLQSCFSMAKHLADFLNATI